MSNYGSELQKDAIIADRYILKEYKGSGSFGEVWLAEDTVLGIDVAIKLYISLDQKGQDEFKDEYKIAYGLSHENLLTAQHYSVWEHRPYLIMKYCSNGSAANCAGEITEDQLWRFIHDVANGLKYLHAQEPPIIHQDIKPENILIDEQHNFLITDFGISKKMRSTMRKQSKRAIESGAIAYMGPERFLKDPIAVKASDIWSLGVSIYELATNELPFMGQGGGMLNAGAAVPELDGKKWSSNLSEIMQACLAKETWDRPTAEELSEYTQHIIKGNNISWSKWKKGIIDSKPIKINNRIILSSVIGVIFAVGIGLIILGQGRKRDAIMQRYSNLASLCDNNIKIGSPENYSALLEAKKLIDSLNGYHSTYSFISHKQNEIGRMEADLSNKLNIASKAWARSAKGQYEIANDIPAAISYYHIASFLNSSSEITTAINNIVDKSGCKGAYMAVKQTYMENGNLIVSYNGLNQSDIEDVLIEYEIIPYNTTEKKCGQATVEIKQGDSNRLMISLGDISFVFPCRLSLSCNNVVFYRTRIDK